MEKVSFERCENYDYPKVKAAVTRSFENLGGVDRFINKGDRALLKVNLLLEKKPESHATTHPALVKALAEILIAHGASVIIGDSPGGPFSAMRMRNLYRVTGMQSAADETGAALNWNFGSFEKENPKGLCLKKVTACDMLNDVDKIISVAKLKTHGMMTFTGAVKNMFGIVPGVSKAMYHLNMSNYTYFANAMIDVCLCAAPVLSFMDAVTGMEGAGPSGGKPRDIGVVIASASPYHLDSAATKIIGLSEGDSPILRESIKRGLVKPGLADIELVGGSIKDFYVKDYDIPKSREHKEIKSRLLKPLNRLFSTYFRSRPAFIASKCVKCEICADNCPPKIIIINKDSDKPLYNPEKCIRCYCCHELCPKAAIEIYRPGRGRKR